MQELIDNDGIPFWAKPSLQKVMETVEMEREQHIKALPERKTGKWINEGQYAPYHGEDAFYCSLCGGHVIEWETQVYGMNPYCKWCGAKMEVDE